MSRPLAGYRLALIALLAAPAVVCSGGCASIISGRHADVAINSYPPDAEVSVRDSRGNMVASARTPAVLSLKRGDGFFKRAEYSATIEKPGYATAHVPIQSRLNPWVLGNLAFGGLVGLVVDPYTGAMWQPTPKAITEDLQPSNRPGPEIRTTIHDEAPPEELAR